MKIRRLFPLVVVCVALVVAGCGGGSGVPLGEFPSITKTEGDAPFDLTAPTSASPAHFTFTSSDPNVATLSGRKVTVLLAGTTTIMAQQPSLGSFYSTSTSAVLTVLPRVCTPPTLREKGVCVQPCVAPATRQNGECVAPVFSGNYLEKDTLIWMPPLSSGENWSRANAFCSGTKIQGETGWRLPTEFDLNGLVDSGLMNGQGWTLGRTWSSTTGANATSHLAINLSTRGTSSEPDGNGAYVVCVRNKQS